jgi:class 3 adenylate cyclase
VPGCGAALTLACAACGANNQPGERFCGECGKPLLEAAKPAAPPDPRSYTPKHLAEKILTSRSALEGERKQVTVLFADVKGSMDLAEQVDPEDWHKIMDRFFAILSDGVHRFEGTINQHTGDGIVALFGAPSPTRNTRSARATPRRFSKRTFAATRTSYASRQGSASSASRCSQGMAAIFGASPLRRREPYRGSRRGSPSSLIHLQALIPAIPLDARARVLRRRRGRSPA